LEKGQEIAIKPNLTEFQEWAEIRTETAWDPEQRELYNYAGEKLLQLVEARDGNNNRSNRTILSVCR
jgi:hypothetical protein